MDVTDDVERPGLPTPVGPQPRADDLHRVDLLDRTQAMDEPQPFALHFAHRSLERLRLPLHRACAELPVGTGSVAFDRDCLRQIEYDRDRQRVPFLCERD